MLSFWLGDRVGHSLCLAPDGLAEHGELSSLFVGEPEPSVADLFTQDLVLGLKVLDDALLVLVENAGDDYAEELPRVEHWSHWGEYDVLC